MKILYGNVGEKMTQGRPRRMINDNNIDDLKISKESIAQRKAEQKALEGMPEISEVIPNYLDHMAKIIYKDLITLMKKGGLPVSELDKTMIATFAMTYSHWRKLNRDLLKNGITINEYDDDGNLVSQKLNVSYNAMLKSQTEMRQMASQLGLTMNSRLQLVVPDSEEESDQFLELLKGNGG